MSDSSNRRKLLSRPVSLRNSLQLKLFVPVFLGLLILITFQTRIVSTAARDSYQEQNRKIVRLGSRALRTNLLKELSLGHHGRDGLDAVFKKAFEECRGPGGLGGAVLDLEGRAVASAGVLGAEGFPAIPETDQLMEHEEFRNFTGFFHESEGWLASLVPVANQNACRKCHGPEFDLRGWIIVGMPTSTIQSAEKTIHQVGIVTAVVLTVVFGGTVWLLVSLHVRRPLRAIMESMGRVMGGSLSARCTPESGDEIGLLGESYNAMVERLEETDRKLRDANLKLMQRAERMVNVGEMASRFAHEIRNPLAGIEGVLSVLYEELPPESPDREILQEAKNQVNRIDRTVSDILTFARPSDPDPTVCDLDRILSPLISFCRQSIVSGAHKVHYHPGKEVPRANLDADQTGQALMNVILNAVQSMDEPGEITVTTGRTEWGEAEILVSDTGPGIPADLLPILFDAFVTTRTKGTGLGLAISRSILARHGGSLDVAATGPDGTTFRFVFPPALG